MDILKILNKVDEQIGNKYTHFQEHTKQIQIETLYNHRGIYIKESHDSNQFYRMYREVSHLLSLLTNDILHIILILDGVYLMQQNSNRTSN